MPDARQIASHPNNTAILAVIVISYVMIVLDISVVLTGLPKIHRELGFSDAGLAWVQSAYTLTFGGVLLLGARAGDILGRRRMFIVGTATFTLAAVAIGALAVIGMDAVMAGDPGPRVCHPCAVHPGFAADAELNASASAVELQGARLPDRVQVHSDVEAPLRS
jgi:MFS family permease